MNTEFSKKLPELWKKIGSHGVMVLATCADGRVSSRPVSVVVVDGKFYFQTDESSLKCKQLAENENAALSVKKFLRRGEVPRYRQTRGLRSLHKGDEKAFPARLYELLEA